MAIDFGLKQIGIAVSDPLGMTAQGVKVIKHKNNKETLREVTELIVKYEVARVLMGNPLRFGGGEGTIKEAVDNFAAKLHKSTGVPVTFVDERLTTLQAEKMLIASDVRRDKRKEVIDMIAAQLILQGYLDSLPKPLPDAD